MAKATSRQREAMEHTLKKRYGRPVCECGMKMPMSEFNPFTHWKHKGQSFRCPACDKLSTVVQVMDRDSEREYISHYMLIPDGGSSLD